MDKELLEDVWQFWVLKQHLAITPGNRMETEYLFYYLMNAYNFVRDIGNETSQMNLSAGVIAKIKVLAPPLSEQRAIAAYLDQKTAQIDRAITHTEHQIARLQEYRTALISAAVTGKVDVRDDRLSQPSGTTLPATLAGIPVSQMPPRPSEAGSV